MATVMIDGVEIARQPDKGARAEHSNGDVRVILSDYHWEHLNAPDAERLADAIRDAAGKAYKYERELAAYHAKKRTEGV